MYNSPALALSENNVETIGLKDRIIETSTSFREPAVFYRPIMEEPMSKQNYLRRIKPYKSISMGIIEMITNAVINGEIKPGDRLPTEFELAESFGVSRNAVREAIKVLEFTGVVEIRHAEGTFLCEGFNANLINPILYGIILKSGNQQDIYSLRQAFDLSAMMIVMEKITDESLADIQTSFRKMEKIMNDPASDRELLMDADIDFHRSIYVATQSTAIVAMGDMLQRITSYTRTQSMM